MVDFTIKQPKTAKGFTYSDAPQRSPEWVANRHAKVTASRLGDWLAVGKNGKPLKRRSDYETELAYERQFGVSYQKFVTKAMQDGIDYEDALAAAYGSAMGVPVEKCGFFYNDRFGASPDRLAGDDGLIECKVLGDSSFADVLTNGVPTDYQLQIQGQLWATGRKWCDFVAGNLNTSKFKVIRVLPDTETIERIRDSLADLDNIVSEFDTEQLYDFTNTPQNTTTQPTTEEVIWV